jgi:hypothetical protein
MKRLYVVKIIKERVTLGEEAVMVRIVKPIDLNSFLSIHAGENEDVRIKQVQVYE